jgi:hypothetical protein
LSDTCKQNGNNAYVGGQKNGLPIQQHIIYLPLGVILLWELSSFGSDLPSQSDAILQGFENVYKVDTFTAPKI